jgi:hypothetical protein
MGRFLHRRTGAALVGGRSTLPRLEDEDEDELADDELDDDDDDWDDDEDEDDELDEEEDGEDDDDEQLLDVFFDAHDPTQLNRQGNDIGSQYRSAIFFTDEPQRQAAEAKIAQLTAAGKFPRPIVTTLEPLTQFFPAEDYHQDYARLNPDQPYIQAVSTPKACKVRDKHAGLMRK